MNELEELDSELDVAKSSPAKFQIPIDLAPGDVLLDTSAHRPGVLNESGAPRRTPHVLSGGGVESIPEFQVPCGAASLEEGLELPGLRPLVPIALIGFEGAHEGTVAPLRAQIRVNGPQGLFCSRT